MQRMSVSISVFLYRTSSASIPGEDGCPEPEASDVVAPEGKKNEGKSCDEPERKQLMLPPQLQEGRAKALSQAHAKKVRSLQHQANCMSWVVANCR